MYQQNFYNESVVAWARANLQTPVEIKLRYRSPAARIFVYVALFIAPAAFIFLGIFLKITGSVANEPTHPDTGALVCGVVLLIPFGLVLVLGKLTQARLATSLDVEGVNMSRGRKFKWEKLHHVDHVSKYFRYGTSSRRVKDNQLELVFENGKVIIPPLIFDRETIWALVDTMPVEIRDDGVPRVRDAAKNILAAIAELKASASNVTPTTPQPQIQPEQSSQVPRQTQRAVEPEERKGPRSEKAVAESAVEILRRHFDPEGLPVTIAFPPWSWEGFANELRSQTYEYVRTGEHKHMLNELFAELARFCKSAPGESYDYRLYLLVRPWLRDSKSHIGLMPVLPTDALVKWDEFQEMLDREYEEERRRADQSGY